MKKINYILTALLLLFFFAACSSDDDSNTTETETIRTVSDLDLSKQNAFIDEEITLTFNASSYDSLEVTSTASPAININATSDTSYTLTASQATSGYVAITTTNGEETQTDEVFVNFLSHGTTDYETIEGIIVDQSNMHLVELILGEPEKTENFTQTVINAETGEETSTSFVYYHYLSKGITISIRKGIEDVTSVTLFGKPWAVEIDGEIFQGDIYKHDIGSLGNFTNSNGILMDDVVTNFGLPAEGNKLISESNNSVRYNYPDVNSTLTGGQIAVVYFDSSNIDEYQGKSVSHITLD